MIEIDSLTKRYGRHTVVDNLSFRCEPGEVLGFLGPNGAGKSTTMKMLAGFLAAVPDCPHVPVGPLPSKEDPSRILDLCRDHGPDRIGGEPTMGF